MAALPPLRFSVSIETMFREMPFEQRMEHVAALGFSAFQFWSRNGRDMNITLALKTALHLDVSAFIGSTAHLVDRQQHKKFEEDIIRAASLAVDLSCSNLIVHSGPVLAGVPREEQHAAIVEALQAVIPIAQDADVTIVLEPRNQLDYPDNYLVSSDEGFQIMRTVNSPHVRLLFSVYHQQISEGNLSTRIEKHLDLIGYIHVADVPGYHEPGTGEISYEYIFAMLREKRYRGFIGLEYEPLVDAKASLRAVRAMGQ
ncbi:MAG: TIM barrel protein [Chloroflexaceae bacterium]|nr:TIM barrel protein [Chloroflexaceae bacterium]